MILNLYITKNTMEGILDFYKKSFANKDPDTPYIESCNDLFGFNCSNIDKDMFEQLFEEYQLEMGRSVNVIQGFDYWMLKRLPASIINHKVEDDNNTIYFENVKIYRPYMKDTGNKNKYEGLPDKNGIAPLYPKDALLRKKTYACEVTVDIYTVNKTNTDTNPFETKKVNKDVLICEIPIIKGSHYCWLKGMTDMEKISMGECFNDPQGYFIIKGMEKVSIALEKAKVSQYLIYHQHKSNNAVITNTFVTTSNNIKISLEISPKVQNTINVSFYMTKDADSFLHTPVLVLSVLLHMLYDSSFVETSVDEKSMMDTCRNIIDNIIVPEILQFAKPEEKTRLKYRLISTITQTIALIERSIILYIKNAESDDSNIILDPISILINNFVNTKYDKEYLIESVRMNIFPSTREDSSIHDEKINDFDNKRLNLSKMISVYLRYLEGFREIDDRDSYINKRLETVGKNINTTFTTTFNNILKLGKLFKTNTLSFDHAKISKDLVTKLTSGVATNAKRVNFSEDIQRINPSALYSQLQRVGIKNQTASRSINVRTIHPTQIGYICSGETPDGENCGILKNLTTMCWISITREIDFVDEVISEYLDEYKETEDHITFLINGSVVGWILPENYMTIKKKIKTNINLFDVTISFNEVDLQIDIFTMGSIPTRPLLVVNPDTGIIKYEELTDEERLEMTIMDLVQDGILEFNSPEELDNMYGAEKKYSEQEWYKLNNGKRYIKISEYTKDVSSLKFSQDNNERMQEQPFTHAEIVPHSQFGYAASCIPKANHIKGPRVTYQSSMFKQALNGYNSVHAIRYDKGFKIHQFPSRAMFETSTQKSIGLNAMPATASPIIALMAMPNNNEDAVVAKREFLDNNLRDISYSSHTVILRADNTEKIDLREQHQNDPRVHGIYKPSDNVSPDLIGLPKLGVFLNKDDVFLAKYITEFNDDHENIYKPQHSTISLSHEGFVVGVEVDKSEKSPIVKVKIAQFRRQVLGDKVSSRYSQKGTYGQIRPEKDLPKIVSGVNAGVVPDFWFNPHSIPSRLTQSKILEIMASKASLITGKRINASSFSNYEEGEYMKVFEDILRKNGMESSGLETLQHSDGTLIKAQIFVGVCAYQTLKHQVADKISVRDIGLMDPKTFQPVKGRANIGGIQVGEMERDAMLSHGISNVVMDRMKTSSDSYFLIICKNCGNIAQSNFEARETHCMFCPDSRNFGVLNLPYISHLIIRLLNGAGIHIHFKFD